jgi:DNA-binding NarL/FixJ family response regulator
MSSTLLIIHPKDLVARGLESLLGGSGLKMLPPVSTTIEGLKLIRRLEPSVVVLSDVLPDESAFDSAREIHHRHPRCRVVMIGTVEQPTYLARAVAAGVQDYLFESTPADQIVAACRAAAEGKPPEKNSPYGRMLASLGERNAKAAIRLSPREQQTLRHVAHGLSNEEIARSMGISIETVKEHVQKILRKLKMGDRTQAAVWALRHQVVD